MKQPRRMSDPAETILASIFKPLMNRVIIMSQNNQAPELTATVPKLKDLTVTQAKTKLTNLGLNLYKLGSGNKVLAQGIKASQKAENGAKVFVLTSGSLKMPTMKGWSIEDVHQFSNLTGIKVTLKGSGKVYHQNISPGTILKSNSKLKINLKE